MLALLAGAAFPAGLAPLDWWWVIVLSAAGLLWLLKDLSPKQAAARAWWYGFGFWGTGVSWVYVSIHYFGGTNLPLSVLLTGAFIGFLALFHALQGYLFSALKLQRFQVVGFPALWVLMEWMRTWFLSGFPWLFAGYGFIDTPLRTLAPISGVMALSFIAVLIAAMLVEFLRLRGGYRLLPVLVVVAIYGGALSLQKYSWTYPDLKDPLKVSIVQGNIAQQLKWDPEQRDNIIHTYTSMTIPLWGETDLVIWPEAAIPVFFSDALPLIEYMDLQAKENGAAFIAGVPFWEPSSTSGRIIFHNSVFSAGQGSGIYHKQKLVPFGEYVPLENWIRGAIPFFDLPMSSFTAGSSNQQPLKAKGFLLAPYICYEIVYPELVRTLGIRSDVLLTISNDAWFGHSLGPLQHFEMARMRALEMGRYLIRSTNTGISAIVDHHGKVVSRLPSFEPGVLTGEVYRTVGTTPYARWGDWPLLTMCAALFLLAGAFGWVSKPKRAQTRLDS
ncbi:Apolipoprotein N-acyltransferase [gamma proteobacterium HdN1]|nr:Apolipoprotein N-acyltransferase [gamma proteobacterium HdN1]